MSSAYQTSPHSFRWHYIAAVVVSIALSIWGAYAISIPNPDSVLYLSAADAFAGGHWSKGLAIYKWPTYSLLIAAVMTVTGLGSFLSAQIVNGLLILGVMAGYISLARLLSNGDRAVVTVATIMIALQPQLTELRPWVIRDLGYVCFFVWAVYFAVADNIGASTTRRLALLGALVAAVLFRVEGLYLALLVVFYYLLARLRTVTAQVAVIVVFLIVVTAMLPFVYQMWLTGTIGKWISGAGKLPDLGLFAGPIEHRVRVIETQVLFAGSGPGWIAYISIAIGLVIDGVIRALTPAYAGFGIFAFMPNRLVPTRAILPIAWFTIGQLPMFFLFAFINAFLAWRFALSFALIGMLATVFCMTTSWRELLMGRTRAFLVFPAFVVLAIGGWIFDIPKTSDNRSSREAATWIEAHVPEKANVWINDPRIAYFAGRELRSVAGTNRVLHLPDPSFVEQGRYDVLVLASGTNFDAATIPISPAKLKLVAAFRGEGNAIVRIFVACPAMTDCQAR